MRNLALAALALLPACSGPKAPEGTAHPATLAPAPATEAPATEAPASAAPASAAPASEAPASAAPPIGPPVEPVQITATPTPDQQARADALAADILAGKLNRLVARQPQNAFSFLFLAASHPRAEVVGASLENMSKTWRRTGKSDAAPLVDADYVAVVRARLASPEPRVRGGALLAARLLLTAEVPDEPVLAAALELAKSGTPAERVAAAALLMNIRDFQLAKPAKGNLQARIVDALLAGLAAPEPYVTAAILDKLSRAAYPEIVRRDDLKAVAEARLTHEEPGIRGTATLLLARLARPAERVATARTLLPGLEHPSLYVKAATVEALALLEHGPAVHAFVPLLDLDGPATLSVGGFTGLDGEPGSVELLLEGGQTVDSVVLYGLRNVTRKAFDFSGGVSPKTRAGLVDQAKAWYAKNQGKYPKP